MGQSMKRNGECDRSLSSCSPYPADGDVPFSENYDTTLNNDDTDFLLCQ